MKRLIALHGNPGRAADWDELKRIVNQKHYELVTVDAYADDWLDLARTSPVPLILIGHSWGCFRILKNLKALCEQGAKIEKVVLVNPYLVVERPLSGLASQVLKLPLIGDKLIQNNHEKSVATFFQDLVHPEAVDGKPIFNEIREQLADWRVWERAAKTKLEQQNSPLTAKDVTETPLIVLTGGEDRLASEAVQREALALWPKVRWDRHPRQGHGLLWARPDFIIEALSLEGPAGETASAAKIGYYPGEDVRNNVVWYMEEHVKEFPDRVALRWAKGRDLAQWTGDPKSPVPHEEITYRDFAKRINSFAQGLKDIGIAKGDRVIIFLPMSLDMYTAMFGVQRIGAIAVFLDSWARSHHLGASAECVGPKAMVSFKQAFDLVDEVPEFKAMPIRIMYGPGDNKTHGFDELLKDGAAPICPVESEFPALITFTTGSTGKPKGANRTHRFLSAQHLALDHVIPYIENDVDMPAFPIFSLNNLASGVTTILPALNLAAPSEKDPALLAMQIISQKINMTTLSPSMLVGLSRFAKAEGLMFSGLTRVVTGGAPISKDDVRRFYEIAPQSDLWILYGSTEAEPMAHIEGREMLADPPSADPEIIEEGVNVGHISEDIDYKFIRLQDGPIELGPPGWSELEVPRGQVGEFVCTGDHVCREYYNNPSAFKTTKILGDDGRVWHRTGDLGYLDSDQRLWIVGRVNNAIARQGKYYFPVRAEVILKRLPFVHRCAFLGMPDAELGEKTLAAIELNKDLNPTGFDFAEARREVHRVFHKNQIPLDEIYFINAIPMDPRHHSKVEYGVLRKVLLEEREKMRT